MLSSIFLVAIGIFGGIYTEADSDLVRKERPLPSSFDEIVIDGNFDVSLIQLTEAENKMNLPPLEIETTTDGHSHILADVTSGHILSIGVQGVMSVKQPTRLFIRFNPPLRSYSVSGAGSTVCEGNGLSNPANEKFIFFHEGASNVNLKLNVFTLEAKIQGAGQTQLSGEVRDQANIEVRGTREVDASKLTCKRAMVSVEGTSKLTVSATDDIEIMTGGVSKVFYRLPAGKQPSKAITGGLATIERLS